jgi:hypothetical protein
VAISAFIAGAIGGILTNPIEFLAVNRQIDHEFSIKKTLRDKKTWYDMWIKGTALRAVYNGGSAVLFFILL